MEYGNFYKIRFSQGGIWRMVLVHEQVLMHDFYLIAASVMELQEVDFLVAARECNKIEFVGKRVRDVFDQIGSEIKVKIPLKESAEKESAEKGSAEPNFKTVSICAVLEERKKAANINLGPQLIETEITNKQIEKLTIEAINCSLELWNYSLHQILIARHEGLGIIFLSKYLSIRVPPSFNYLNAAALIEYTIFENPEILKEYISYKEMLVLSKLIDFGFERELYSNQEIDVLKTLSLVKEYRKEGGIKPFAVPSNVAYLLHDYIREACEDQAYRHKCNMHSCFRGLLMLYGYLRPEKLMEMLSNHFVLEYQDVQEFTTAMLLTYRVGNNFYVTEHQERTIFERPLVRIDKKEKVFSIAYNNEAYKHFSLEEIYAVDLESYYFQNEYSNKIYLHLKEKKIPDIESEISLIWIFIQSGFDLEEISEMTAGNQFTKYKIEIIPTQEEKELFISYLQGYANSMPRWICKGYSYNELKNK